MLLVQNNGGAISVDQIAAKPVALLLSGPAAAVGALAYYGRATGSDNLISMEIGGTSCDVIVMNRGSIAVTDHFQVAGHHLALPSVEVHSVGAGGGTIGGVDSAGMLFVGPQGASKSWSRRLWPGRHRPSHRCADCAWSAAARPFAMARWRSMHSLLPGPSARVVGPLGISVEDAAAGYSSCSTSGCCTLCNVLAPNAATTRADSRSWLPVARGRCMPPALGAC
jgi:N-methylhydantoinase A